MKPFLLAKHLALAVALAATGCTNLSKQSAGLLQVDGLVAAIERVHVESQIASKRGSEALGLLLEMTAPDFAGDPVEAYAAFVGALEASEEQGERVDESIEAMHAAAGPFFEQWTADLEAFKSPEMRLRSQTRLAVTQERYDAIVAASEPVQTTFHAINEGLRDHALFLGHDFNSSAVADIEDVTTMLTELSAQLEVHVEACRQAAREYVQSSALPVRAEVSIEPGAPAEAAPGN